MKKKVRSAVAAKTARQIVFFPPQQRAVQMRKSLLRLDCCPALAQIQILLMGRSGSGKTSMRALVLYVLVEQASGFAIGAEVCLTTRGIRSVSPQLCVPSR